MGTEVVASAARSAGRASTRALPVMTGQARPVGVPIQRKAACACGGGCPTCRDGRPLQMQSAAGQPGDPQERQADRVADQVMRMSSAPRQIQRQPAAQPAGRPGTSVYTDNVSTVTTNPAQPGLWRGMVRRQESTPAGRVFHTGRVPVHYNENSCRVTIPMRVAFRNATLADVQRCPPQLNRPAPAVLPAAVDRGTFRRIADQYVRALNEDLNGWYTVRFRGCETNPCHGRDMPIEVRVSEVTATPDYQVAIANLSGRSCVDDRGYTGTSISSGMVLLYAQGLDRGTMMHEGGHMVLGHGDEYRELEQPGPNRPPEREREEWTAMGSHHDYGRFAVLHARHFQFVPVFLNNVRPGCDARLDEGPRPLARDITFTYNIGYVGFRTAGGGFSKGLYQGLGLELGLPLSKLRKWRLLVGLHGRWLAELDTPSRSAFLAGLRVGVERTSTPWSGGLTVGGYGETGLSWFQAGEGFDQRWTRGGYAEGGAFLGYTLGGKPRLTFGVEAAAGTAWSFSGASGAPGASTEPNRLEFFRLGVRFGGRF